MKRLTALMLCLMLAMCILPAQALTLPGPFTFDLATFQAYYPMLIEKDVTWTQQGNWIVGSAEELPDLNLYMSEAGDVEYMMVQISSPMEDADEAMGEVFGLVASGAALGVLLCEVTDEDALNTCAEIFLTELENVLASFAEFDSATDEQQKEGLTSSGPLANHEGCVGIQINEDDVLNLVFMFAPDGTQF